MESSPFSDNSRAFLTRSRSSLSRIRSLSRKHSSKQQRQGSLELPSHLGEQRPKETSLITYQYLQVGRKRSVAPTQVSPMTLISSAVSTPPLTITHSNSPLRDLERSTRLSSIRTESPLLLQAQVSQHPQLSLLPPPSQVPLSIPSRNR